MIDPASLVRDASFLVTGGAGFIGCHTIDALLRGGARRVIALDNLSTGRWDNVLQDDRVERVTADLARMSPDEMQNALRGVDYLLHLAAEKHNIAIDAPERKVIFASSLYANGRMTLPPMREDDVPEPKTVYGISKLAGEHLLRHFAAQRWTDRKSV